jgi:predicted type IV restriction endonuclease
MRTAKSDIDRLIEVINKLEGNKDKYHNYLEESELLTRYVLIDPLLRALGWDTENPSKVRVEHKVIRGRKRRADYALFGREGIVALIEVKSYGTVDKQKAARQVASYRVSSKVPLGIVTDGGAWYVYNLCKRGCFEGRRMVDFGLGSKSPEEVKENAQEALQLTPTNITRLVKAALKFGR